MLLRQLCCQALSALGDRTRCQSHFPGHGDSPEAARAPEMFGQCSEGQGEVVGGLCRAWGWTG